MSTKPNEFYFACRNNDIAKVKQCLVLMSADEINKIEENGSTALHAASYYGHFDVVKLLLEHPQIIRSTKNKFKCTPFDEAATPQIKQLFERLDSEDHNRFVGETDKIEWLDIYQNAYRIAFENHNHMRRWLTKIPLKKLLHEINNGYIDQIHFRTSQDLKKIKFFMYKAIDTNDPIWLINMYTAETAFYSELNKHLAKLGSDFRFEIIHSDIGLNYDDSEPPVALGQYLFAAIIINHPTFEKYCYTGQIYRGMNIQQNDLEQYAVGSSIMTRSFLSASRLRHVATQFLRNKRQNPTTGAIIRQPILCVYNIKNERTSLYIKEHSEYASEEEVLIVPFTAFKVTKISDETDENIIEIHLDECEPNIK